MTWLLSVVLLLFVVAGNVAADDDDLLVIGAGFGRTGTASTKAALEQLGFGPTHHMFEVITYNQAGIWADIGSAETKEERHRLLKQAMQGYRSSVDFPSCGFYKDLMEIYPNAKVLLTTRTAQSWANSAWDTVLLTKKSKDLFSPLTYDNWMGVGFHILFTWTPTGRVFSRMLDGAYYMMENATQKEEYVPVFEAWEAEVEASVPADRLLKFSVAEGWEPLAKFLGVDVPDTPFPRVNDKAAFLRTFGFVATLGYLVGLLYLSSPFIVYSLIKRFCCKKKAKKT